jgi:hypothetical protein
LAGFARSKAELDSIGFLFPRELFDAGEQILLLTHRVDYIEDIYVLVYKALRVICDKEMPRHGASVGRGARKARCVLGNFPNAVVHGYPSQGGK